MAALGPQGVVACLPPVHWVESPPGKSLNSLTDLRNYSLGGVCNLEVPHS